MVLLLTLENLNALVLDLKISNVRGVQKKYACYTKIEFPKDFDFKQMHIVMQIIELLKIQKGILNCPFDHWENLSSHDKHKFSSGLSILQKDLSFCCSNLSQLISILQKIKKLATISIHLDSQYEKHTHFKKLAKSLVCLNVESLYIRNLFKNNFEREAFFFIFF